jgi:hypothetical protein
MSVAVRAPEMDYARLRFWAALWMLLAALAAAGSVRVRAEEDKAQKELEARLKAARENAAVRSALDNARTDDAKKALKEKMKSAQAKDQEKKDLAEFKQKTLDNLGSIKELFAKGEEAFKNQKFGEAGQAYSSVALATVPGSEEMVETSRGRLVEMEDLAQGHLKAADDSDLKREYVKEVEELALICKEFGQTKTKETALRRLITLKSRPEVAGYVEMAHAESLETDGKLIEAATAYDSVARNPRYENTIPGLKARRKLADMKKDEATGAKLKAEADAKADREAPILLASAKNFVANNRPKDALEKLQIVVEKFPNTKYAEEAQKRMAELK